MRTLSARYGSLHPSLAVGVLWMSLGLLAGCRGEEPTGDPGLVMELGISPTPPGVGPARLIISLADTAGSPLSGAEIVVEGNMSHAGMVPVLDTARMEEPGHYVAEDFTFTMAGDWVLTLVATLPDGRIAVHQEATNVVAPPPGLELHEPGHPGDTSGGSHPPDTSGATHSTDASEIHHSTNASELRHSPSAPSLGGGG